MLASDRCDQEWESVFWSPLPDHLALEQLFGGTNGFELLETPFEQHRTKVGQRAFLTRRIFLKLGTRLLTDSNADLDSPFTHLLVS